MVYLKKASSQNYHDQKYIYYSSQIKYNTKENLYLHRRNNVVTSWKPKPTEKLNIEKYLLT